MLTSSSGTNSEHEDIHKYEQYAIPSELMSRCIYSARFVNQIAIVLSYSVN